VSIAVKKVWLYSNENMQPVPDEVKVFVEKVTTEIINPIIAIIFAGALLYMMYGLMVFILNAGDESKRADGKRHIMYGLIGMTIMVSVYAILEIGLRTIGVSSSDIPKEITPINL